MEHFIWSICPGPTFLWESVAGGVIEDEKKFIFFPSPNPISHYFPISFTFGLQMEELVGT